MTVTPATIVARFPEFESQTDVRIEMFIDDAKLELSESKWGDRYDKGLSYLTAHFLAIALKTEMGSSASIGAVASRSIGDVSVSFTNKTPESQTEAFYNSTPYGQEYWNMLQFVGLGAVAVSNVNLDV